MMILYVKHDYQYGHLAFIKHKTYNNMSLSLSNLTKTATTNYYNNTQLGKNDTLMAIKIFEVEFL